jgi:ribonuclease J
MKEIIETAANGLQETSPFGVSPRTQVLSRKFPRPGNDSILTCPVGGVGQIGMNWTLYGHAGKWILVDAGSAFAPRDVDGVDAIFPDPRSLRAILPNLAALIVTHAHEDHIGAIHRLWPALGAPILATPFAAKIIGNRLRETNSLRKVRLSTFNPGETLNIGPFSVKTVQMTHSVPECVSLAITTPSGTVFHSGDSMRTQSSASPRTSTLSARSAATASSAWCATRPMRIVADLRLRNVTSPIRCLRSSARPRVWSS